MSIWKRITKHLSNGNGHVPGANGNGRPMSADERVERAQSLFGGYVSIDGFSPFVGEEVRWTPFAALDREPKARDTS